MDDIRDHCLQTRLLRAGRGEGVLLKVLYVQHLGRGRLPDAGEQQVRAARLRQKIGRAKLRALRHDLLIVESRNDNCPCAAVVLLQILQDGQPVHLREDQIRHENVRLQLGDEGDRPLPVVGRSDDLHVPFFFDQIRE